MKTEREMFEEWIKNEDPFVGNDDNPDCIWAKKYMWNAWQARVPDGYKLVPVEATEIMTNDGCGAISYGRTNEENVKRIYKAMIGAVE